MNELGQNKWAAIVLAMVTLGAIGAARPGAPGTAASGGPDYGIVIERPYAAGKSYNVIATDTYRSSEKVDLPGGMTTRTQNLRRLALEAEVRIDKVDAKGGIAAQSVVVKRLTQQISKSGQEQGKPMVLLEPGTELTMTYKEGQATMSLKKGGLMEDEALSGLQQGFAPMSLTDAVHGSKERKKAGDTWPVNTGAIAYDKSDTKHVDPSLISGTMALKGVRPQGGVECLQLEGSMVTKQALGADVAKEATVTVGFTLNLPVDGKLPAAAWSVKSETHVVMEEELLGRGKVVRTVDLEISHEASWTAR
jgi:hypothetical protein